MVRKAWLFGLALVLTLGVQALWAHPEKPQVPNLNAIRALPQMAREVTGNESINSVAAPQLRRDEPDFESAYGEEMIIDSTWYDYQANGTIGKMIAKDSQGGVHFVLMKGEDSTPATGVRHVVYNMLLDGELIYPAGQSVTVDNAQDNPPRAGYTSMALLPADQRALIFYHVAHPQGHAAGYTGTAMGVDFQYGFGAFSNFYPNPWQGVTLIWPRGAVSRSNVAHILATESPDPNANQSWQRVGYWRGTTDQSFQHWNWNDPPVLVDTASTISQNVSASHTSNKVVMAWFHNMIGVPQRGTGWDSVGGYWQLNNDIHYIVSDDGQNFDFEHGVKSLTKIIPPNQDLVVGLDPHNPPPAIMQEAYGDTFRPFCDLDIQFDPWGDDNLYAVFPTEGLFVEPWADRNADGDASPVDYTTNILNNHNVGESILWFWNSQRDTMTMVADAWYPNVQNDGQGWFSRDGGWRCNADRGSIAFNPDHAGTIYVVWVNFPQIMEYNPNWDQNDPNSPLFTFLDGAQDTSAQGYSNAEVMVSISTDYGITWREPINLTQTRWDDQEAPRPGEMASEAYASVAYLADDTLHISFVRDTEAGGVVQDPANGATATNNPYIYLRVPIADLPLNDPVALHRTGDGTPFQFHNYLDIRPVVDLATRDIGSPVPEDAVNVMVDATPGGRNQHLTEVVLEYVLNGQGDTNTVAMDNIRGDTTFSGNLPPQLDGTTVWYRVRATNDAGNSSYDPIGYWHGYVVRGQNELRIHDIQFRPEAWAAYTDASMYDGYEVTVSGTVTTSSEFARVYGGYAIQDDRAPWCGVIVRNVQVGLQPGDHVIVDGTVFDRDTSDAVKWEYETYIQASAGGVEVVDHGVVPEPLYLPQFSMLTFAGGCESLEGLLVRVSDAVVTNTDQLKADTTDYWDITDGVSIGKFSAIGMSETARVRAGIRTFITNTDIPRLVGVFTENYGSVGGGYAIVLRDSADLVVDQSTAPTPYRFTLSPAYPNPFNPTTTVNFSLPRKAYAELGVFDLQGRLVAMVTQGQFEAGNHAVTIDASALSTGVYILRLDSPGRSVSQKLVLMK